jgi:hypothetical protein
MKLSAFRTRVKRMIRRMIGDPPMLLEEYPECPGLFHQYRALLAAGHKRAPGGWEWQGRFYPDHLTVGGACFGAFRLAQKWCHGNGIDVGAGAWPFPGSRPIDPLWYPTGLRLEEVPDASQDYVFTSHTLEHIDDWKAALEKFWSKVRDGGTLFVYLPHPNCGLWRMDNPFMREYHRWVPEPAVVKAAVLALGAEIVANDDGPDVMMSFFVCARKPVQVIKSTADVESIVVEDERTLAVL